jgi:hypothetical protein
MTAGVSDPLPARSNGPDNIDGGPDRMGYSAPSVPEQGPDDDEAG